jgi:2-hydroxychromene-2-carboxylate isomerase
MTTRSVDFYYDYGSPSSYLAWTQLARICREHGATLNYKPIVLGAIFKATGNASPVTVPAKGRYTMLDFGRWAKKWGVPLRMNPHFPIDTVELMKAGYGVQLRHPERFEDFNRAAFTALWVDARNLNRPEEVARMVVDAGFDPGQIRELVQDPEVRAGIRRNTEEAVARGVFGAPTFFVGDQMYWGQDRLFMVEEALTDGRVIGA